MIRMASICWQDAETAERHQLPGGVELVGRSGFGVDGRDFSV